MNAIAIQEHPNIKFWIASLPEALAAFHDDLWTINFVSIQLLQHSVIQNKNRLSETAIQITDNNNSNIFRKK
jgi:hypothetical protein